MKRKKIVSILMAVSLASMTAACGSGQEKNAASSSNSESAAADETGDGASTVSESGSETTEETDSDSRNQGLYASIVVGETGTDLDTSIRFLTDRSEVVCADGSKKNLSEYVEAFEKAYPGIRVELSEETDTDELIRKIGDGNSFDVCMIPEDTDIQIVRESLSSFGTKEELEGEVSYVNRYMLNETVYGIPIAVDVAGIVYNRDVFEEAGITELPKTPSEFINDLSMIEDRTDAIPLYTNYNEDFAVEFYDIYIGGAATGDYSYVSDKMTKLANPFAAENGNSETGPYAFYKILYDAAAKGLTESSPEDSDFADSLSMLADGKIGCMALGSYVVPMIRGLSDHPDSIGFMAFPITVNEMQYASVLPDAALGISAANDDTHLEASEIFVKWMTEESGIAYDCGALSADKEDPVIPELLQELSDDGVVFVEEAPQSEEFEEINEKSGLHIRDHGAERIRELIDHAIHVDLMYDQIVEEWNDRWSGKS